MSVGLPLSVCYIVFMSVFTLSKWFTFFVYVSRSVVVVSFSTLVGNRLGV